jgi:argininosuccinate synthase
MFDAGVATYGETNELWDGRDAQGFTQIYGVQALLARRARSKPAESGARSESD